LKYLPVAPERAQAAGSSYLGSRWSGSISMIARNAISCFYIHMSAADMEGEGVEQAFGQAFASKFFSANRTSRILPFENPDAQHGLIFRHSVIFH
jgi:hypothetical protein